MKKIKSNKEKLHDLQMKIGQNAANLSYETPLYGEKAKETIQGFLQACEDIVQDNAKLLVRISKTNIVTSVTIMLGDKSVTKNIAEWIWRRREYAELDQKTWTQLTDRGLKEGVAPSTISGGEPTKVTIIRHYDPLIRDQKLALYKSEPHEIDGALEVANAITDLLD